MIRNSFVLHIFIEAFHGAVFHVFPSSFLYLGRMGCGRICTSCSRSRRQSSSRRRGCHRTTTRPDRDTLRSKTLSFCVSLGCLKEGSAFRNSRKGGLLTPLSRNGQTPCVWCLIKVQSGILGYAWPFRVGTETSRQKCPVISISSRKWSGTHQGVE